MKAVKDRKKRKQKETIQVERGEEWLMIQRQRG